MSSHRSRRRHDPFAHRPGREHDVALGEPSPSTAARGRPAARGGRCGAHCADRRQRAGAPSDRPADGVPGRAGDRGAAPVRLPPARRWSRRWRRRARRRRGLGGHCRACSPARVESRRAQRRRGRPAAARMRCESPRAHAAPPARSCASSSSSGASSPCCSGWPASRRCWPGWPSWAGRSSLSSSSTASSASCRNIAPSAPSRRSSRCSRTVITVLRGARRELPSRHRSGARRCSRIERGRPDPGRRPAPLGGGTPGRPGRAHRRVAAGVQAPAAGNNRARCPSGSGRSWCSRAPRSSPAPARFVVRATGMQTEIGAIAQLTQAVRREPSPLQREMGRVTRVVAVLAVALGLGFFLLGVATGSSRVRRGIPVRSRRHRRERPGRACCRRSPSRSRWAFSAWPAADAW